MATDTAPTSERDDARPPGPDVRRLDLDGIEARPFPGREPEYRVVLEAPAHAAILAHARSNAEVELCGVLVGDLFRDEDGPFLVITDVIRGRAAKQGDTSVTFTHSTWEQIHREMDAKHAGRRIVGWYHTHPGFGVFLSEVDLFAHRNFFDAAWQVALVVDPKADQVGLFFWKDGQVVRARRFWVGDEVRWDSERPAVSAPPGKIARPRPEAPGAPARREADAEPRADDGGWWNTVLLATLGVICVVLAYLNFTADLRNAQLGSEAATLRRQLGSESASLARALAFRLRDQLDRGQPPSAAMRAGFDEATRLDPENRPFYETFLPELAPPPRPRASREAAPAKGRSGGPAPAGAAKP